MAQTSNIKRLSCHKVKGNPYYLLTIIHNGGELGYYLEEHMVKEFGLTHSVDALLNLMGGLSFITENLPREEVEKCEMELDLLTQAREFIGSKRVLERTF
ncbi:hypothetical protein Kuja_1060 [Vibrio phage vB_VchM_Kuja]|uniref:Uncharacterized protein n=1 Tax=Vibrio phage vB_VchM_Kuja TaxID=2686437 RepID=A0A6B9JHU7_9CAUD|nr:hypothetical protein HWC83_gp130 [Vibrio phage vB_VchM_Kuja]QGZ16097.1 hypothetical protein Kuja_1060 [Vibrio phage vB_VchM_Kuja]